MTTIPYRTPQRPTATPDAVLAYCEAGHTNAQAAEHFGITDRYVRKLKSRARGESEMGAVVPISCTFVQDAATPTTIEPPPLLYATVVATAVARDGQFWKCPKCGQMMEPLPGTTGEQWKETGCYLCATPRPALEDVPTNYVESAERQDATGATVATGPEGQDRPPELEETSPSLDVPGRNTEHAATPTGGTGPGEQAPTVFRERIIERVVYRVPVERPTSPVVTWAREHMPPVQVLVAFLIAALLVGVASLG